MTPEEREAWLMRNMYPDGIKERPTLAQRQAALAAMPDDPDYDGLFSDPRPPTAAPTTTPASIPTPTKLPNASQALVKLPAMNEVPPPVIPGPKPAPSQLPKPAKPVVRRASQRRYDPHVIANSEWHDIPSCPGYAVSKECRVLSKGRYTVSLDDCAPRWLEPSLLKRFRNGNYWKVRMRINGQSVNVTLHSLMVEVFMDECPKDHKLVVGKGWIHHPNLELLKYAPLRGSLPPPPKQPRKPRERLAARLAKIGDTLCQTSSSESSSDSPPSSPSPSSE